MRIPIVASTTLLAVLLVFYACTPEEANVEPVTPIQSVASIAKTAEHLIKTAPDDVRNWENPFASTTNVIIELIEASAKRNQTIPPASKELGAIIPKTVKDLRDIGHISGEQYEIYLMIKSVSVSPNAMLALQSLGLAVERSGLSTPLKNSFYRYLLLESIRIEAKVDQPYSKCGCDCMELAGAYADGVCRNGCSVEAYLEAFNEGLDIFCPPIYV